MTEYCVPTAAGEVSFTEKRYEFLGHVRTEIRIFCFLTKRKYNNIDWMTRYTSFQLDYNFLHF